MIPGIVIGSIIGAIALILCIPFYVALGLRTETAPRFRLRLRWLGGAFKRQIPGGKKKAAASQAPKDVRHGPDRECLAIPREMMADGQAKAAVSGLLRAATRNIRLDSFQAECSMGMDDPEAMAFVIGPAGAASAMLNLFTDYQVQVRPSLDDGFHGSLDARFHLRPIRLVPQVMRFLISRTGRRLFKLFRKAVSQR